MLSVRSLVHRYDGRIVLNATDVELAHGEHCALTGASGTGKTTLLHILAGILQPSAGRVDLEGDALYETPPRDDCWRAKRIGVVPQKLHLLASLSALDNVQLARYLVGATGDDRARTVLAQLGLQQRLHARPNKLSVGEQQRVAIARAIVNSPRLLLADEPTSSLDDDNAQKAVNLLFDAARISNALLIVATHDARIRDRFTRTLALTRPTP